jgi:Flp pilus assembly pilin Flp
MKEHFFSKRKNEYGATAIEYALIVGAIALIIAAAVYAFGDDIKGFYEYTLSRFRNES